MANFIVHLKDGKQFAVEAASYAARDGCLCLVDAEQQDVAAFPFMGVAAVLRAGLAQPLASPAAASPA